MIRTGCFALMAMLACLAGCADNRVLGRWDAAVQPEELAQADLTYYWRLEVDLQGGESLARIWHVEENVYCLTSTNRVIAFDAARGLRKWSADIGDSAQTVFPPCHADNVSMPGRPGPSIIINPPPRDSYSLYNVVVFNTVTAAMVVDRSTGRLLHRIDFANAGFAANTGGVSDGSMLYVGSVQGWYYAIDMATGLATWWRSAGGMISASPMKLPRRLYIASQGGTVVSTSTTAEGQVIWTQTLEGSFAGDFAASERGLFLGNLDYSVYALDPLSGRVVWRFRTSGPIQQTVQLGETNVYAAAAGDQFYAIDVATGREKWTLMTGRSVLMERGDDALVLTTRNDLLVTDKAMGRVSVVVPMTGLNLFVPNTTVSAIYAASRNGLLCCIRPVAAGYLTPEGLRRTAVQAPSPAMPADAGEIQSGE